MSLLWDNSQVWNGTQTWDGLSGLVEPAIVAVITSAPLSTGTTITDESRSPATAITSAPLTVTTISGSTL